NVLNTLQTEFVAGIFDKNQTAALQNIVQNQISSADRLAIYRNNAFSNLRGALQSIYPVVNKLVGADFFDQAANEFIRATPSSSGDLHDYGEAFAGFLKSYPPASHLLYLPDVAKLEWCCHRVFHAADHGGLDLKKLGTIPPEQYGELRFDLHPASALLSSNFPTLKIWQVNQDDYKSDQSVELNQGGNHLLVCRDDHFAVRVEALSSGDYAFLNALREKNKLEVAAERGLSVDEKFDLGASLQRWVAQKILVDCGL
ncbi:MAG: hypothetical protein RL020_863, partial [Pseudomonadota bacterium]